MPRIFDLHSRRRDRRQPGRRRRARHRRHRRQDRRDRRSRRGAARASASIARGLHILPGVIDSQVHFREPGLDPQGGSRDRLARGRARRRHRRVRNAQHRSADDHRRGARRQGRARQRAHALRLRLLGRRHARQRRRHPRTRAPAGRGRASRCSWAPRPASCSSPTTPACSRSSKATRRRAAFHSEDEARLNERKGLRVPGDPSSHPVWRDEIAALRCTERLIRLAREARAQVHVLHISTREEIALLHGAKDVATCEATPHHLTLQRRRLRAARHEAADEPAGARARTPRRRSGAALAQGVVDVLGSDHAPHTLEEKAQALSRKPLGHDRRADAGADHARPRRGRAADACSASSISPAPARRASSASSARAASRPATTPISPSST